MTGTGAQRRRDGGAAAVICRSAVKPMFIGLGTAAVLAAGGASALAADTPSPSAPGTTASAAGKLDVHVTPVAAKVDPKDSFDITTTITAVGGEVADAKVTDVAATLDGTTVTGVCGSPFTAEECGVGDLADEKSGTVKSTLNIPADGPDSTTDYKVTVTVKAAGLDPVKASMTITYVVPESSPSPTPTTSTPTPSKSPSKSPS
ncbi:hypothetical protein, partial [Actinomadura sp.]|uniref:hypothetical protein n=1 Tax=Actinomadura sp. TaxID=1989 RepID=UPI0037CBA672